MEVELLQQATLNFKIETAANVHWELLLIWFFCYPQRSSLKPTCGPRLLLQAQPPAAVVHIAENAGLLLFDNNALAFLKCFAPQPVSVSLSFLSIFSCEWPKLNKSLGLNGA